MYFFFVIAAMSHQYRLSHSKAPASNPNNQKANAAKHGSNHLEFKPIRFRHIQPLSSSQLEQLTLSASLQ